MTRLPSFESQRPIMAPSLNSNRTSKRFSTVSGSPSLAMSDTTLSNLPTGDSRLAEIKVLSDGLRRLEDKNLMQQRFVPTAEKSDDLNKLALGAKVERALGRRMSGQDAVMRKPGILTEKEALATEEATA